MVMRASPLNFFMTRLLFVDEKDTRSVGANVAPNASGTRRPHVADLVQDNAPHLPEHISKSANKRKRCCYSSDDIMMSYHSDDDDDDYDDLPKLSKTSFFEALSNLKDSKLLREILLDIDKPKMPLDDSSHHDASNNTKVEKEDNIKGGVDIVSKDEICETTKALSLSSPQYSAPAVVLQKEDISDGIDTNNTSAKDDDDEEEFTEASVQDPVHISSSHQPKKTKKSPPKRSKTFPRNKKRMTARR